MNAPFLRVVCTVILPQCISTRMSKRKALASTNASDENGAKRVMAVPSVSVGAAAASMIAGANKPIGGHTGDQKKGLETLHTGDQKKDQKKGVETLAERQSAELKERLRKEEERKAKWKEEQCARRAKWKEEQAARGKQRDERKSKLDAFAAVYVKRLQKERQEYNAKLESDLGRYCITAAEYDKMTKDERSAAELRCSTPTPRLAAALVAFLAKNTGHWREYVSWGSELEPRFGPIPPAISTLEDVAARLKLVGVPIRGDLPLTEAVEQILASPFDEAFQSGPPCAVCGTKRLTDKRVCALLKLSTGEVYCRPEFHLSHDFSAGKKKYPKWVSHANRDGVFCGLQYCSDECRAILGHVYHVQHRTADEDYARATARFEANEDAKTERDPLNNSEGEDEDEADWPRETTGDAACICAKAPSIKGRCVACFGKPSDDDQESEADSDHSADGEDDGENDENDGDDYERAGNGDDDDESADAVPLALSVPAAPTKNNHSKDVHGKASTAVA